MLQCLVQCMGCNGATRHSSARGNCRLPCPDSGDEVTLRCRRETAPAGDCYELVTCSDEDDDDDMCSAKLRRAARGMKKCKKKMRKLKRQQRRLSRD